MEKVSNILNSAFSNYTKDINLDMFKIWDIWNEAVGVEISKHAKPKAFKDNILLVNVSSSVWMQHLNFSKENIIKKINEALKEMKIDEALEEIKFKIGEVKI